MLQVHQSQNLLIKNENRIIKVQLLNILRSSISMNVQTEMKSLHMHIYKYSFLKPMRYLSITSNFEVVSLNVKGGGRHLKCT